jgi:23S rRNA (uracil1939-C5)-methyltransferase
MGRGKLRIREQVTIDTIADGGVGMGRVEGKVIFVEQVIPGDVVDVQQTKKYKDYEMGYVTQFHTYSPLRVTPFCDHFQVCGGCTWQNVSYETQLDFKQRLVEDAFRRIGKFTELPAIEKITGSPYDRYYRNKLEFTFTNSGYINDPGFKKEHHADKKPALGFHVRKQFANVFDIKHCYLQPSLSNEIRLALKSYGLMHNLPFFDLRAKTGYLRNVIIRNSSLGNLMVIIVVAENKPDLLMPLMAHVKDTFPEITSLYYCISEKNNDTIFDQEVVLYSGEKYMIEQIDEVKYHLGPKSFFQTNFEQAKHLYHKTLELADLQPDDQVYDFYTGLGSIALLAAKHCKKVVGVELIEPAIEDAKMNATFNNIHNCTFIAGDMAKIFTDEFISEHGRANVVITDPPRAGMHKDVCLKLLDLAPEKIVYVSCNPVTQARDIQILAEKYDVTLLQPVDMFPQTYHVENIALLIKKS